MDTLMNLSIEKLRKLEEIEKSLSISQPDMLQSCFSYSLTIYNLDTFLAHLTLNEIEYEVARKGEYFCRVNIPFK